MRQGSVRIELLNGIGYVPLVIAATAACWFHYANIPEVIRGVKAIDHGVALTGLLRKQETGVSNDTPCDRGVLLSQEHPQ